MQYERLRELSKQLIRTVQAGERLLFPSVSLATGKPIVGPGLLEPHIWKQLNFIGPPFCDSCGVPMDAAIHLDLQANLTCASCMARKLKFDRARAALVYDDISRDIVLRFKQGGERSGLRLLANWMTSAAPQLIAEADVLVPVPLHYKRLLNRGFNQSLRLAAAISRVTEKPLAVHALKRLKATSSQAGKSARGRKRNVQGAFGLSVLGRRAIVGKRVLLIDDVYTTGATVEACANCLKHKGGAAKVDVLTLARVVRPVDATI